MLAVQDTPLTYCAHRATETPHSSPLAPSPRLIVHDSLALTPEA